MASDGSHATPHLPEVLLLELPLKLPSVSLLCDLFPQFLSPLLKAAFFLFSDAWMSLVTQGLLLGKQCVNSNSPSFLLAAFFATTVRPHQLKAG